MARSWTLALLALGLAVAVAYLALIGWAPLLLRAVAKPVPILCLAVWVGTRGRAWPGRLAVAGLVLSATGDVVLLLEHALAFPAGLGLFLVAHLLYTAAFTVDERALRPVRALPFAAAAAAMYAALWSGLGEMWIPVALYCGAIGAMGWRAAARVDGPGSGARWIGVAGAALFMASDSMVAWNAFREPLPYGPYLVMTTYYLAQAGIAVTVVGGRELK